MTQNKPPPAFQEYAANMMASVQYRVLNLSERGLLYTMRLECWVNQSLPTEPEKIAKILGFRNEEVKSVLPAVMPFFAIKDGEIVCPELEDYRAHLEDIRSKQSSGGKAGAAKTNWRRKSQSDQTGLADSTPPTANPQVTRASTRESLVKSSLDQHSKTQPVRKEDVDSEWLNDYERASNGS